MKAIKPAEKSCVVCGTCIHDTELQTIRFATDDIRFATGDIWFATGDILLKVSNYKRNVEGMRVVWHRQV